MEVILPEAIICLCCHQLKSTNMMAGVKGSRGVLGETMAKKKRKRIQKRNMHQKGQKLIWKLSLSSVQEWTKNPS